MNSTSNPPRETSPPIPRLQDDHVLIAAGSGITPVLSIAASVPSHPDSRVTLLYGNRHANTVMFADELADLKDTYGARFQLIHVLSREPRALTCSVGASTATASRPFCSASFRRRPQITSGCAGRSGW